MDADDNPNQPAISLDSDVAASGPEWPATGNWPEKNDSVASLFLRTLVGCALALYATGTGINCLLDWEQEHEQNYSLCCMTWQLVLWQKKHHDVTLSSNVLGMWQ